MFFLIWIVEDFSLFSIGCHLLEKHAASCISTTEQRCIHLWNRNEANIFDGQNKIEGLKMNGCVCVYERAREKGREHTTIFTFDLSVLCAYVCVHIFDLSWVCVRGFASEIIISMWNIISCQQMCRALCHFVHVDRGQTSCVGYVQIFFQSLIVHSHYQ